MKGVHLMDADLDVAIPGAASAIFFNHGQCCCAGSRLYVHERLFDSKKEGAKAVTGGKARDGSGYLVEPTVFVDTKPGMKIVKEEIFGPVVTVTPFAEAGDALVHEANDTIYGLAAGIWTRDLSKAHALAARLKSGTVWINCYNIFDAALPFGGYKQSGWGREMGEAVLDNYLATQAVTISL